MAVITHLEDLRSIAQRKVPRAFFDYVESGAYDERTLAANKDDLDAIHLAQRVLVGVENQSMETTILGRKSAMPLALAPTGLTGLIYPNGEIHACKAANSFGVPYTLSTVSICSLEEVAEATDQPFWFQLYIMRDRVFVERLIQRAQDAGCDTLVLTVDLPVQGQRHADIRNGLSVPPRLTMRNAIDIASKPAWALGMMRSKRRNFGNLEGHIDGMDDVKSMAEWTSRQYDPSLTWEDVKWVRSKWKGNLVIKGIMDPQDAIQALDIDVQGIIVSNHGGRQLDGSISTVKALPRIVDVIDGRIDVFVDGGIRSGSDVLKMINLGAKAVFIGRAFLYGLGAMGEAGVTQVLTMFQKELGVAMALTGKKTLHEQP
ncbi:MAG: L-lactate dehydrogenase [Granulosicoccus sp.]